MGRVYLLVVERDAMNWEGVMNDKLTSVCLRRLIVRLVGYSWMRKKSWWRD